MLPLSAPDLPAAEAIAFVMEGQVYGVSRFDLNLLWCSGFRRNFGILCCLSVFRSSYSLSLCFLVYVFVS